MGWPVERPDESVRLAGLRMVVLAVDVRHVLAEFSTARAGWRGKAIDTGLPATADLTPETVAAMTADTKRRVVAAALGETAGRETLVGNAWPAS
jgi:hypothetical protein